MIEWFYLALLVFSYLHLLLFNLRCELLSNSNLKVNKISWFYWNKYNNWNESSTGPYRIIMYSTSFHSIKIIQNVPRGA